MRNAILVSILFTWIGAGRVNAQDTAVLCTGMHRDSVLKMDKRAFFYFDKEGRQSVQEITHQPFFPYDTLRKLVQEPGIKNKKLWSRWYIHNPGDTAADVSMVFHRFSFISFYVSDKNGFHYVGTNQAFYTNRTKNERRAFTFHIDSKSTVTIYAAYPNFMHNYSSDSPVIMKAGELESETAASLLHRRYYVFTDVFFLSVILFIVIHTLAQYFFNRRREFLLYTGYALSVFIFFLFKFDENGFADTSFSHFPYIQQFGNNPFSYLMYYAYYRFVRSFIDFKAIAPWFYRCILITEKLLLTAIVADILFAFPAWQSTKSILFNVMRSYLIIVAFTGIILLLRTRKPLSLFIAVGSGFLITGGLAAMVLTWIFPKPHAGYDPIVLLQLGMVLELLCFTLGLSYKTSLIEKEKRHTQLQLIVQLEENRLLQDEMNTKLETRVQEQTEKIIAQQQQLEKEKEQQLMLEFTRKITEMELQLLKSQLNPHFYFNTLNNLYGLAMIAPKKAPDAILKLSDIMEYVIYDCRHDKVPLNKEVKFLQSYVELERLRYENDAHISLSIKGDMKDKYISPMLLIQFVENGFKHGMELQKTDNYLTINILVENGRLLYESINSINGLQHEVGGIGLSSIKKRLEMLYPNQHILDIHTDANYFKVALNISL